MGNLYRAISADGSAFAEVLDAKDIVSEIERIHKTSAVITAGLGRLTIAASLMGYMLKGDDDSVTLRVDGGGPSGQLVAVADSRGNVKSCVNNPVVELPLNAQGKLDVGGAVGRDGTLSEAKEAEYGSEVMRELERVILLKVVDTKWMAHIDDMEELKKGIGLRSYGQKNPVIEYRYEGFEMFDAMVDSIREDTIRMLLTVRLQSNEAPEREQVAQPDAPNAGAGDGSFSEEPVRVKKIGDNDPCPCGSGKKYKKCCKAKDIATTA